MFEYDEKDSFIDPLAEWWDSLGEKPFGCNEKQVAFARYYIQPDMTAKQAARQAGYSAASDTSLANQGSQLSKNPKVLALMEAAKAQRDEVEDAVAKMPELLELWSKEARYGKNPATRLKAGELVARYWESRANQEKNPEDMVQILIGLGAAGEMLARDMGLETEFFEASGKTKPNGTAHA